MTTGWRFPEGRLSPFESIAALYGPAGDDLEADLVEAGAAWTPPHGPPPGRAVVWGNVPAQGGPPRASLRWAVRRERALRTVRTEQRGRVLAVHRLPPAVRTSRVPRRLRAMVLGGLLVELSADGHERIIDRVLNAAGGGGRTEPRLRPSRDGSALVRMALGAGGAAELRVSMVGGRKDPQQNAAALTVLEQAGIDRVPRLRGHGLTSGASWTTESLLPGRLPRQLNPTITAQVSAFLALLPRRDEATSFRERMIVLAERYPRWASLARQLADRAAPRPGVLQHGDLWIGNLLLDRDRLVGIIDWDTWHPAGVPGSDLLQLLAMERRRRTGEDIGALWTSGLWRSDDFRSAASGYWRAIGVAPDASFLELLGLDWWSSQVLKRQSFARRAGWLAENVDRVLAAVSGTR